MTTLAEIQDAVARLPADERKALLAWLESEHQPEISRDDEQRLLRSLAEAIREIDADKRISIGDARKRVGSWAAK